MEITASVSVSDQAGVLDRWNVIRICIGYRNEDVRWIERLPMLTAILGPGSLPMKDVPGGASRHLAPDAGTVSSNARRAISSEIESGWCTCGYHFPLADRNEPSILARQNFLSRWWTRS